MKKLFSKMILKLIVENSYCLKVQKKRILGGDVVES